MPAFDAAHWTDGVVLDGLGRVVGYNVLRSHPGDFYVANLNPLAYDRVPARYVVHWFRKDRPGQVRGVPESHARAGAVRRAAPVPPGRARRGRDRGGDRRLPEDRGPGRRRGDDDGGDAGSEPFKTLEIERDLLTMLPAGTDIRQLDAKQPTTTFDSFQEKLLGEACRCLDFPLNLALGTSQKFNFSSARMDWFKYHGSLEIERGDCECVVLDPLVRSWADEAVMVPGLLPDGLTPELLSWEWHWPGFPYMDPLTDAKADTERLTTNKTLTYARYYARRGLDWRDEFAQEAAETRERERLGLPPVVPTKETITETDPGGGSGAQREEAAAAA
jgi:capsid protein